MHFKSNRNPIYKKNRLFDIYNIQLTPKKYDLTCTELVQSLNIW